MIPRYEWDRTDPNESWRSKVGRPRKDYQRPVERDKRAEEMRRENAANIARREKMLAVWAKRRASA